MTFQEMVEKDLANCSEFGGIVYHTLDGETEPLEYLCFDENTEVVLERDGYSNIEASVPALTMQTAKAEKINHRSLLEIDGKIYGVIEKSVRKDNTTIIFLDVKNG